MVCDISSTVNKGAVEVSRSPDRQRMISFYYFEMCFGPPADGRMFAVSFPPLNCNIMRKNKPFLAQSKWELWIPMSS